MLQSSSWPPNGVPVYGGGTGGWCPPSGVPCNEGTSACYPSYGVPCYGDASDEYGVSPCAAYPTYGMISYETATSHTIGGTGTAYIAPQVFTVMPTLSSWHGMHDSCCKVQQNPIPSSCVQDESTNLSEQYLGGMPQRLYGLHNLNRQRVFLADGTEHSFYALPENYSAERHTSSPSPAVPTVEVKGNCQSVSPHMKGKISEQQPHIIQETKSLHDMLAEVRSKLASISENISQDLESMKQRYETNWDCSKQIVSSKPNPPTQVATNVLEKFPVYDVYIAETRGSSDGILEQQQSDGATADSPDVSAQEHSLPRSELCSNQVDVNPSREKSDVDLPLNCPSKAPEQNIDALLWPEDRLNGVLDTAGQHKQYEYEKSNNGLAIFPDSENASESEEDNACLTYATELFDCKQQQQDDEKSSENIEIENSITETSQCAADYTHVNVSSLLNVSHGIMDQQTYQHKKPITPSEGSHGPEKLSLQKFDEGLLFKCSSNTPVDIIANAIPWPQGTFSAGGILVTALNIVSNNNTAGQDVWLQVSSTDPSDNANLMACNETQASNSEQNYNVLKAIVFVEAMVDMPPTKPPAKCDSADIIMQSVLFTHMKGKNSFAGLYFYYLKCNHDFGTYHYQLRCCWEFSILVETRLQWDPGVNMLLFRHSSIEILTTGSTLDKPLIWFQSPLINERHFHQLTRSITSYIWDPSTKLMPMLQKATSPMLIFQSKISCRIPLWLINFEPP